MVQAKISARQHIQARVYICLEGQRIPACYALGNGQGAVLLIAVYQRVALAVRKAQREKLCVLYLHMDVRETEVTIWMLQPHETSSNHVITLRF